MLLWLARGQAPFREISDGAILELYTLQALDWRLLAGPYSRFGWHHPGPLYFYALAPFYALSGCQTAGAQVGAFAINLGAVGLIAWAGTSCAAVPVAAAITATSAWLAVRSADVIVSVWNPHVIVLPLLAFVVVASAFASTGRRALGIWLIVLGSFLVQTHLATAPIVAVLGVAAFVPQRRTLRGRFMALAIACSTALWFPAILEQLTHSPGNMTKIAGFFGSGGPGQTVTAAAAAWSSMLVAAFTPGFSVASGRDFAPLLSSWRVLLAAAEIAALVAAANALRRRSGQAAWLAAMCAAATVVALAATSRIRDQIVDHEVFWISGLGALNVGTLLGAAGIMAPVPAGRRVSTWTSVAAVAAVALVGCRGVNQTLHRARTIDDHGVDVLVEQFNEAMRASSGRRALVHIEPPVWPIAAGALLQARKAHAAFAVDDRWVTMFGEAFAADGREDVEVTFAGSPLQPRVVRNR